MNASSPSEIHSKGEKPTQMTALPVITGLVNLPETPVKIVDTLEWHNKFSGKNDANYQVSETIQLTLDRMRKISKELSPIDALQFVKAILDTSIFKKHIEQFRRHWSFIGSSWGNKKDVLEYIDKTQKNEENKGAQGFHPEYFLLIDFVKDIHRRLP